MEWLADWWQFGTLIAALSALWRYGPRAWGYLGKILVANYLLLLRTQERDGAVAALSRATDMLTAEVNRNTALQTRLETCERRLSSASLPGSPAST